MCQKKQFKYCPSKIDDCMKLLIEWLNNIGYKTVACCCGHWKYPMTIVVALGSHRIELLSAKVIPRKTRFYKKDKNGYYYIPEVSEEIIEDDGFLLSPFFGLDNLRCPDCCLSVRSFEDGACPEYDNYFKDWEWCQCKEKESKRLPTKRWK